MRQPLRFVALFLIFAAAASLSLWLNASSSALAVLWLPNALAFVLWLRVKPFDLSANSCGLALGISFANLMFGMPFASSTLLAATNVAEVFTAIALAKWALTLLPKATEAIRGAVLILIVGVAAPLLGASIAASILYLLSDASLSLSWLTWISGSMLGAVLVLPLGLTVSHAQLELHRSPKISIETFSYLVVAVIVSVSAILSMRFPFVAVTIPIILAAIILSPFQTALIAASAVLSVYFSSFLFIGQMQTGYYPIEIGAASALAAVPAILLSMLRAELDESRARLSVSERLFRTAMESSAIGMAIVDNRGRIRDANERFGEYLGYTTNELRDVDFRAITHPDDLALDEALLQELLAGRRDHYEMEKRYINKDGQAFWGLLAVSIIRGNRVGETDFFISQIVDIDARKTAEASLQDLNARLFDEKELLRITLYSIGDAVITTDRWTRITFMNPVAERLTGWSRMEADGLPLTDVFQLVMEATGEHVPSPVDECLKRSQPFYLQDGVALVARDGKKLGIQDSAAPVRGPDGVIHGAVLIFQDVSEARSLQREMLHSAMHDTLTDLPNRRSFEEELSTACADLNGRIARHALGYIDLDRFKLINDTAGHAAGDAALKEVARILRSMLRAEDVVARLGGDEFGIILMGCSIEKANSIAEKLVTAIRATAFHWDGRSYELGASIGLTEISGGRRDPAELLVQADIACYAAKTGGRNRALVYHGESHDAIRHRRDMDVATMLKTALDQRRFHLFAQELVPINDKNDSGRYFEVFIRLVGHDGEYISPAVFIPAAERYNMMGAVDRWVITETLDICSEYLRSNVTDRLSINISADSIDDSSLSSFIEEKIRYSGVRPEQICFEITETAVMSNVGLAVEFVSHIQRIGAKIALDDFGVGMSSFAYLKLFKADEIKIDASFVRDVGSVGRDREIISAIVGLGRALGIETVAEGIETAEQFNSVRDLGVSMGQGYHFGRPMPIEAALNIEVVKYLTKA